MKAKTLAKAKELEDDIRAIRMAMTESSNAGHFAMLENYAPDARRQNLPKWLRPRIMVVLGEERERLEYELETLTDDDNEEHTNFEPTGKYNVEPKADEIEPSKQPCKRKRDALWNTIFFLLGVIAGMLLGYVI